VTTASGIDIGHSGIDVTVTGNLEQQTGSLSLQANAASMITTSSGALTITAAAASTWSTTAGALTLTSAAAATWSTAAGALSISGKTALNLQIDSANKLVIGSSTVVVQDGVILATTGTGNINLPSNFQIAGTGIGSTVTAPNLDTLTNGGNADALHEHAASGVITRTAAENITAGAPVCLKNDNGTSKVNLSDADGEEQERNSFGFAPAAINSGASGDVQISGEVSVPVARWTTAAPAAADVGKKVYLSTTEGQVTLTAPSASGATILRVAFVTQGGDTPKVVISIGEPTTLA
jgi:hypothetical protein